MYTSLSLPIYIYIYILFVLLLPYIYIYICMYTFTSVFYHAYSTFPHSTLGSPGQVGGPALIRIFAFRRYSPNIVTFPVSEYCTMALLFAGTAIPVFSSYLVTVAILFAGIFQRIVTFPVDFSGSPRWIFSGTFQ